MHDCQKTKEQLLDLIFGELEADENSRSLAQIERCPSCDAEYRSLASTLFIYDRAALEAQPDESFFLAHHERLRESVEASCINASHARGPQRAPVWKRIFSAQLRVPAPLAVAAAILLAITTLLALRTPRTIIAPVQAQTIVETRTVEVPVPQERVVVKTVYVERSRRDASASARRHIGQSMVDNQMASMHPNSTGNPRAVLQGFKPADTVNLQIIKGSFPR